MTKEEKAAYMHAYKKRLRAAKERGIDPKTLTLSDFYDDDVAKQERLKTENRLDSIRSDCTGNERKAENLRRAARNYYARHKKESKAYYKKNKEQMKLKCFARYYGDTEHSRKLHKDAAHRYYWKHKNDKTWWEKLISYIRGLKWIKMIRSLKWAH
jgi:hypothetical protein